MSVISRVPLADQIAEVKRELDMRKRVYIRMIDSGKITSEEAETRTLNMAAVLQTLERLAQEKANAGVSPAQAGTGRHDDVLRI